MEFELRTGWVLGPVSDALKILRYAVKVCQQKLVVTHLVPTLSEMMDFTHFGLVLISLSRSSFLEVRLVATAQGIAHHGAPRN